MNRMSREQQIAQAEELLGTAAPAASFAKGLFFGQYLTDVLPPYPDVDSWQGSTEPSPESASDFTPESTPGSSGDAASDAEQLPGGQPTIGSQASQPTSQPTEGDVAEPPTGSDGRGTTAELRERLSEFCRRHVDPVAIDRDAKIPTDVIRGLGELGVLGACLPKSCGGLELSQTDYCQLLEVLGGHCGSTALFVNAHHSIGPRAIVLFGTDEQQRRWLPKLATGEYLSAFALTEPEAGSDASNVQTRAIPTEDGKGYLVSGEKRWITNGGIAQVLTLMARTPKPDGQGTDITALLVTPDMPGFQVVETRMEKCGVRGTATSRLRFENMFVPRENVLGTPGKGLRVALTVLDFGRTTFGASCTGAAKYCLRKAKEHVRQRVQFGQPLAQFELVQEKIARMEADLFAMEACTYQTAALIDAGEAEFMVETAMLKVFTTERLWEAVYDTFQLFGGRAYFCDEPYERLMRDARINSIGEGANDVLRVFSALVGLREVGMELEGVLQSFQKPIGNLPRLSRFLGRTLSTFLLGPEVISRHGDLEPECARLAHDIAALGRSVVQQLRIHQRNIVDRQLPVSRMADAATELYVSACALRRLDYLLRHPLGDAKGQQLALASGKLYLRLASRRIRQSLERLQNNEDDLLLDVARRSLGISETGRST